MQKPQYITKKVTKVTHILMQIQPKRKKNAQNLLLCKTSPNSVPIKSCFGCAFVCFEDFEDT